MHVTDGQKCNAAMNKIRALGYLECSSKTGKDVDKVIETAARAALFRKKQKRSRFRLFGSSSKQQSQKPDRPRDISEIAFL